MPPLSVVPQTMPNVQSVGSGGQLYIANLFGGFTITANKINPLFAFSQTDNTVKFAKVLTNLIEASKIGSTMAYVAQQIGVRVVKLGNTPATAQQVHDMKRLLASARINIEYGSSRTIAGEFTGLHFQNSEEFAAVSATDTQIAAAGPQNGAAWCNLPVPIPLQPSINLGGNVEFGINVPSSLTAADEEWGFIVVLAGQKSATA